MVADAAGRFASPRMLWGGLVAAVFAAYYWLLYFPPRLVGANDPDRYYHLGLSRLISEGGIPMRLPQAEDLGWGVVFPEKEFLFHALTGAADWAGGVPMVLLLVPLLGLAIVLTLYRTLDGVCRPWQAALFATLVPLAYTAFLFRLTILRPHVLAILWFCLLLHAVLRTRPWLALVACAGFALSYHAIFIVLLVVAAAGVLLWYGQPAGRRMLAFCLVGLAAGILLNPYFPHQLQMTKAVVDIALGVGTPPGAEFGNELKPVGAAAFLSACGFSFYLLALIASRRWFRTDTREEGAPLRFLFALALGLTLLSMQSIRALEYAVPVLVLLLGHFATRWNSRWAMPALVAPLLLLQGTTAVRYYHEVWTRSQGGNTEWYAAAIDAIPPAAGSKVFHCQWDASAYLLFLRPDLRFVDALDPTLLWKVAPRKYLLRQELIGGRVAAPAEALRDVFDADYVLCGSRELNRQMSADPAGFRPLYVDRASNPVELYEIIGPTTTRARPRTD
jgi:hypothetical protein